MLIDMFAAAISSRPERVLVTRPAHLALWRADAIHRAKNLSQLATSFANIAEHPGQDRRSADAIADARALARAYEELGRDEGAVDLVPCAVLLSEVALRLTLLFGRARSIRGAITAPPLSLSPERQRALVLICSELVINALKYAFPTDGGCVSVSLETIGDVVTLTVQDDGTGIADHYSAGEGGSLLNQLATILDAKIARTSGIGRRGYCVSVNFSRTRGEPASPASSDESTPKACFARARKGG